jgi:hypothetical protein
MFFFLRLIFTLVLFAHSAFASLTIGEKITQCANKFIGTPYDTNPLGEYVFRNVIIYDEKVEFVFFVESNNGGLKSIVCYTDESALSDTEEKLQGLIFSNIQFKF